MPRFRKARRNSLKLVDMSSARLRALAFYDALDYAPTIPELALASEPGDIVLPMKLTRGRLTFEGREELVAEHEAREAFFPRKIRRSRHVTRFLARLSGVRFVAIGNTTALANARDEGDLDFFIITRSGTIAQTRGWSTLRYKIAGARPGSRASDRDAVCLSYFVDDTALDLSSHMLDGDDPYFRFWFLSLLPLYDDGVSSDLWRANATILRQHPHARPWIVSDALRVDRPMLRFPMLSWMEPLARWLHSHLISRVLKSMMNTDTRVIVNEHALKFHADDGRAMYRDRYLQTLKKYGLDS